MAATLKCLGRAYITGTAPSAVQVLLAAGNVVPANTKYQISLIVVAGYASAGSLNDYLDHVQNGGPALGNETRIWAFTSSSAGDWDEEVGQGLVMEAGDSLVLQQAGSPTTWCSVHVYGVEITA